VDQPPINDLIELVPSQQGFPNWQRVSMLHAAPDKQISLTDPDARSMATTGKDTGMVGYNVQADAQHHLIVAHEVTNIGDDRSQHTVTGAEHAHRPKHRPKPENFWVDILLYK
jgi:hypothetical protein